MGRIRRHTGDFETQTTFNSRAHRTLYAYYKDKSGALEMKQYTNTNEIARLGRSGVTWDKGDITS
jgi:hypothetical protein